MRYTCTSEKTILVIGGAGFIGSKLVELLVNRSDRKVWVLGRATHPRSALPKCVRYIQGDTGNIHLMRSLLPGCDEVVDLSYASVPKSSYDNPVSDVLSSLPPSVSLMHQACGHELFRYLLVSSGGTVYGPAEYLPIDETASTNPISPYGITKLSLEKYALMFSRTKGLPSVIVRPSNPFGPGQIGNVGQGFIGVAISSIIRGYPVDIFGERGTIRDYLYIDDVAAGIIAALDYGDIGGIYNIGTGVGLDNLDILEQLGFLAGSYGFQVTTNVLAPREFDVKANVLDSRRLKDISGWAPRIDFADGLELTWREAIRRRDGS